MATYAANCGHLEVVLMWAQIVALLSLPVIIATVGLSLSRSISNQSATQELARLAIIILSEERRSKDRILRAWARRVLDRMSPVPVSVDVAHGMSEDERSEPAKPNRARPWE